MAHYQPPFKASSAGIEIQGLPDGTTVYNIPSHLVQQMIDYRLHANDLDLAIQATSAVKTDALDFDIANVSLFSAALVFYFRCFKSSASRAKLDPDVIFADEPIGREGHKFFAGIRDKHIVHDENNYFTVGAIVALTPDAPPVEPHRVITLIAQAGIDRDANYVGSLRALALHAKQWCEHAAEQAGEHVARRLSKMGRSALEQFQRPLFVIPVLGDEQKRRK